MSKLIIAFYVLTTSAALVVLKLGTKVHAPLEIINNKLNFNINFFVILGIILYGLSFLTYMFLISKYNLGYIVPLTTAFVYILIFTSSFIIFKEPFTLMKIIGIFLIVTGLVFLNLKK